MLTPGSSTGYWKARNTPAWARCSADCSSRSWPSYRASPSVTVYEGWPARVWANVLLPEPFGPITACTSPAFTVRSTPFRISLPSTLTWRFRTSSSGLANAPLQTDAEQFGRLHRELHWQLAEDLFAEAIH